MIVYLKKNQKKKNPIFRLKIIIFITQPNVPKHIWWISIVHIQLMQELMSESEVLLTQICRLLFLLQVCLRYRAHWATSLLHWLRSATWNLASFQLTSALKNQDKLENKDDHVAASQISFKEAPRHKAHEVATLRVECALSPGNDGPSVSL